ncbi:MAG: patatin-like phospholipase family protein [Gaiellaceae bacterium]
MQRRSIFDGLSGEELDDDLDRLKRRRFPAGSIVLAEGDSPHETYIVQTGVADVFVTDRHGVDGRVASVTPGSTLGEMSMLTGEPAAATVRASSELDVIVLSEADFERLAEKYPLIYRNIGAILSERLDRSNRQLFGDIVGRVTVLRDLGAPPLLGYALACSMSWHLRRSTLLLVLDDSPPEELVALARTVPRPRLRRRRGRTVIDGRQARDASADLMLVTSALDFAAETLAVRVEDFCGTYEHVLVQVKGESRLLATHRVVDLMGADGRAPSGGGDRAVACIRAWVDGDSRGRPDGEGMLRIPALAATDESALRGGALPASGSVGRALGFAARDLARLKVGLALGGGAARGYAHSGVLRAFERAGLPIDYLAGTSIGGAVAGMYGRGLNPHDCAHALDGIASGVFRLALPPTSALLSSGRIRAYARNLFGERRFEDLRLPVAVTAVDLISRQEIVFSRGRVWPAVMATMAIPGVYPPQRIGPHLLVDGGVLNPVPSNVVAGMGADIVIAVNLGKFSPSTIEVEAADARPGGASVFYVLPRSIELMQSRISADTAAAATIVISPPFDETAVRLRRFREGRRYVELGEAAAEEALPRIAASLPWLRAG